MRVADVDAALLAEAVAASTSWADVKRRIGVTHGGAVRDGDWRNDEPDNLRFLCPSCHSQTPTFCRQLAAR